MSADEQGYGWSAGYEDEGAERRRALDALTRRLANAIDYEAEGLSPWYDAADLQPTARAVSLGAAAAVAAILAHDRGQAISGDKLEELADELAQARDELAQARDELAQVREELRQADTRAEVAALARRMSRGNSADPEVSPQ